MWEIPNECKTYFALDSSPVVSPRNTSRDSPTANHQVPFCPTTSHDLRMGMKVSLTRASGRMSRGTVKWIGLLPRHQGDYVGVELESESKIFLF